MKKKSLDIKKLKCKNTKLFISLFRLEKKKKIISVYFVWDFFGTDDSMKKFELKILKNSGRIK